MIEKMIKKKLVYYLKYHIMNLLPTQKGET